MLLCFSKSYPSNAWVYHLLIWQFNGVTLLIWNWTQFLIWQSLNNNLSRFQVDHHSIAIYSKCYTFQYYKIDHHRFIKQESTEFTALTDKKFLDLVNSGMLLIPKKHDLLLIMGKMMRLLSGSLNAEADFYRANETRHYQSFWPKILGTEIPRSEIWRCVDW